MNITWLYIFFSFVGLIFNKKNLLYVILYLEIILLGLMMELFKSFSFINNNLILLVLTISSVEVAIGLSLLILFFKIKGCLDVKNFFNR
nr:NADH dehydrogenase subunit 4L [Cordagalma sp.]